MSDMGSDDKVRIAESLASALNSDLEHSKNGKHMGTLLQRAVGASDRDLMDDFVEVEKLAIVYVDKPFGSSHLASVERSEFVDYLENQSVAVHSDVTGYVCWKHPVKSPPVDAVQEEKQLQTGAVENLLERSFFVQLLDGSIVELDQSLRDAIVESLQKMSSSALRCLGFTCKDNLLEFAARSGDEDHPAHQLLLQPSNYLSIESNLIFVGFAGLRDPPRKEVSQAIEDCRAAGIRVMVITGDNKNTAEAIYCEIGVFGPDEDISSKNLTGRDFMDHSDSKSHLRQTGGILFSRAEPRHKQEIVMFLKEDGEVVAMTGDGVNDAPALKLANNGIAMGIAGTKVASVGEGRSIYSNMKAFLRFFIITILLLWGIRPATGQPPPPRQQSCNHYGVALTWVPTFCNGKIPSCYNNRAKFSIHGVWGFDSIFATVPCDGSKAFVHPWGPLLSQCKYNWPNLNGPNARFWEKEWNEHGHCCPFPLSTTYLRFGVNAEKTFRRAFGGSPNSAIGETLMHMGTFLYITPYVMPSIFNINNFKNMINLEVYATNQPKQI
ncbi:hypothetical protein Vadar_008950 [Vaccinium darrowii]|uniref:Uncharacterized protein n=1 Tax=Vaccinium darrowii TaxID=229202 RepID=A0ACB7WZH1_9ERIC|nr:hypothetical protein Vadar_008950 [Vaccinium darrowii]